MIGYLLEFFNLGINFGLDKIEGLGDALVLSGDGVGFLEAGSQEANKEGSEDDGLHCTIKIECKLMDIIPTFKS